MINLSRPDLKRIPSEDGKRSNDRYRCTVCIDYGSDDESATFTRNNKKAHLHTVKHRSALGARAENLNLEEREVRVPGVNPPATSLLLPLPEAPSVFSAGRDGVDSTFDPFEGLRRIGLTYLDEEGERLEFSAGARQDGDNGSQTEGKRTGVAMPGYSDSEDDDAGMGAEWVMPENNGSTGYWPYPSKTVSDGSR